MDNYLTNTVNKNFVTGALWGGSITGVYELVKNQFKLSPITSILSGSENAIRQTNALFERMNNHDQGVEHRRKNKQE